MQTKYFYDTEFKEDGKTIDLISIGIVNYDTGAEYYAVSNEFDTRRVANDNWLMDNVMSSIEHEEFVVADFDGKPLRRDIFVTDEDAKSRWQIARDIEAFTKGTKPDFTAWYGAYDHVCLCQLWGKMIDLPEGMPMYTSDLKQMVMAAGNPKMPQQPAGNHNALEDAKFNVVRYNFLVGYLDSLGRGSATLSI